MMYHNIHFWHRFG